MDNSLVCPHGAIVLSCIIPNSWGLSKAAPTLVQRLANKLPNVHSLPSSFEGRDSGYDALLLAKPPLESACVLPD